MKEVLKECPFCGERPLYVVDRLEGIYIMCPQCKVRTPGYFDERPVEVPRAISTVRNLWNTRQAID